ncbi:MAG: SDR family oxidoreductase [Anaerolineales bacterium]
MTAGRNAVLITGASTGIGEACALHFAKQGWCVFAGVRKAQDAKRLAAADANIFPLTMDVTKPRQVAHAMARIRRKVGKRGLQGLVNNAGIAVAGPLEFLPASEMRRQFEVNFFAQVELTQACLPLLRLGKGRIANMSSIGGSVAGPFLVPYSSSKFALEAFTDGLRRELRPWGIHVASVQPGAIATPIWEKSLLAAKQTRAKLPKRAEALYGRAMTRMVREAEAAGIHGMAAERVARDVWHALIARRPRTRYAPGQGTAFTLWLLRWLPDSFVDWILTRGPVH